MYIKISNNFALLYIQEILFETTVYTIVLVIISNIMIFNLQFLHLTPSCCCSKLLLCHMYLLWAKYCDSRRILLISNENNILAGGTFICYQNHSYLLFYIPNSLFSAQQWNLISYYNVFSKLCFLIEYPYSHFVFEW